MGLALGIMAALQNFIFKTWNINLKAPHLLDKGALVSHELSSVQAAFYWSVVSPSSGLNLVIITQRRSTAAEPVHCCTTTSSVIRRQWKECNVALLLQLDCICILYCTHEPACSDVRYVGPTFFSYTIYNDFFSAPFVFSLCFCTSSAQFQLRLAQTRYIYELKGVKIKVFLINEKQKVST